MAYGGGIDLGEEMGMYDEDNHRTKTIANNREKRLKREAQSKSDARRAAYAKKRSDKRAYDASEKKINSGNRPGMYNGKGLPSTKGSINAISGHIDTAYDYLENLAKPLTDRLKWSSSSASTPGRDWQNNMPFSPVESNKRKGWVKSAIRSEQDPMMSSKPRGIFEQIGYENSFNEWAAKSSDKELRGREGPKAVRDRAIRDRAKNWNTIRDKNRSSVQEARSMNQVAGERRAFNLDKKNPNNERSLYRASLLDAKDAAKGREASRGFLNARNAKFAGSFTYMYKNSAARNMASAGEHFSRAAIFATAGSGLKRESFMNSLGFLTKHQKAEVKLSSSGALLKSQKWLIPGFAAITGAETLLSGGDITDYAADYIIPETLLFTGWNAGKNAGYGIAKSLGAGGRTMLGAGLALGGTAAVAGLAVGVAAGYLLTESTNSNNLIRETAHDILNADFDSEHATTQSSLTHRQRAMNKLSKSSLNDRGQLVGNEASILAGVY